MYQNFIIPYLYEAQHVSGDTLPIIRSLKLHWQPLVFHNIVEGCWMCSWWTLSGTVLCLTTWFLSQGPLYMYLLSFTTVRKKKTRPAACEDIYNNL